MFYLFTEVEVNFQQKFRAFEEIKSPVNQYLRSYNLNSVAASFTPSFMTKLTPILAGSSLAAPKWLFLSPSDIHTSIRRLNSDVFCYIASFYIHLLQLLPDKK